MKLDPDGEQYVREIKLNENDSTAHDAFFKNGKKQERGVVYAQLTTDKKIRGKFFKINPPSN